MDDLRDQLMIIRDRLIASDPGFQRLILASRATLTSLLALGLMYAIGKITAASLPATLLAVIMALLSSVAVNDDDPKQQRITTLTLPVFTFIAVLLGAALTGLSIASKVVFVAILFASVYARRYGPRGLAVGMLTFITYFFSLFLQTQFSQLPWLLLALILGTVCNYIMRFFIFRIPSEWQLKSLLRAYYSRIGRVIDKVIEVAANKTDDEHRYRKIRSQVIRLNENALMIEDKLEDILYPKASDEFNYFSPVLALFDLELAADRLGVASHGNLSEYEQRKALKILKQLRYIAYRRSRGYSFDEADKFRSFKAEGWGAALHNMATAIKESPDIKTIQSMLSEAKSRDQKEDTNNTDQKKGEKSEKNLRPSTRQAIQVAAAGGLAILTGYFVSNQRWYWAVITAFIVFTGTSSRGETFTKGWQRTAGTLIGVIAGIFIALAVGSNSSIALALIFVCIFIGFYLIQISYALMIFWLTIAIGLLYELFGRFNVEKLLILRLEETALGAAIGILIAIFLLPASSTENIRETSHDFLSALDKLVDICAAQFADEGSSARFMSLARSLDRDFQQLRSDAKPLTRDLFGKFGRNRSRRWLHMLMGCRFYACHLARLAHHNQLNEPKSKIEYSFIDAATHIHNNIQALANQNRKGNSDSGTSTNSDKLDPALRDTDEQVQAAHCLQHIDRLVIQLIRDFGSDN